MAVTFDEARAAVKAAWPDYRTAAYGYETPADWLLLLLPETAGGRVPAVAKDTGTVRWINENSDDYSQQSPVGVFPGRETVPLTAATQPASGHSGAMIALIPAPEDAQALAVDGGEPADQLHCTLLFLGEADMYTEQERAGIVDMCRQIAAVTDPVEAEAFAVAMFNPTGPDPCVVYGLSGAELAGLYEAVAADVEPGVDQHQPYVPHVTAIYSADPNLVGTLVDRCGVVMFDRLRVAFGDHITDLPLGEPEVDDVAEPVVAASPRIPWLGCPRCFAAVHEGPCQPSGFTITPTTGRG